MRQILAIIFLYAVRACGQQPEMLWIVPPDARLEVAGLPWYGENGGELFRLPARLKDTLPRSVWNLGMSPSGGRFRFRTDTNKLAIRLEYPSPPNMANMHAFGQTGTDLYLNGVYAGTAVAGKDAT